MAKKIDDLFNRWLAARSEAAGPTDLVLIEVAHERLAQDAKWGEQNHPDGTGAHYHWIGKAFADHAPADKQTRDVYREWARFRCQEFTKDGYVTWEHILTEEWAEAMAEEDPATLRAELIQIAAVAVSWVEAIDRREADRV